MPSAVTIGSDFAPSELRRLAASTKHANQSRRLLSLAAVLEGRSREEAARIGELLFRLGLTRLYEVGPQNTRMASPTRRPTFCREKPRRWPGADA